MKIPNKCSTRSVYTVHAQCTLHTLGVHCTRSAYSVHARRTLYTLGVHCTRSAYTVHAQRTLYTLSVNKLNTNTILQLTEENLHKLTMHMLSDRLRVLY